MFIHLINFQLQAIKRIKSDDKRALFLLISYGIRTCLLTVLMLTYSFSVFSQPSEESVNLVQQMYIAYYGRPGDPKGLEYWGERFDESENLEVTLDAFGNSAEFTNNYGGLSSAELVNSFYRHMFSRDAEPDGLAFYAEQLETGEASLASIAKQISDGAINNDLVTLENKIIVAQEFSSIASTKENAIIDIPGIKYLLANVTSITNSVTSALIFMVDLFYEPVTPRYRILFGIPTEFPPSNSQALQEGKGYEIIRTQERYESLFGSNSETIDFHENTVVYYKMGVRPSSGYSVKVANIEDQRDAVNLDIVLETPGLGCAVLAVLTHPFIILEVYTLDESRVFPRQKEVLINESIVSINCELSPVI